MQIYKGGDMLFYTDTESKFIWSPAGDFTESDEVPWYKSIYEQAKSSDGEGFSPVSASNSSDSPFTIKVPKICGYVTLCDDGLSVLLNLRRNDAILSASLTS